MEDITISVDPIDVLMSSCPAIEDEDDGNVTAACHPYPKDNI
jgi:hypothetical protein